MCVGAGLADGVRVGTGVVGARGSGGEGGGEDAAGLAVGVEQVLGIGRDDQVHGVSGSRGRSLWKMGSSQLRIRRLHFSGCRRSRSWRTATTASVVRSDWR